MPVWLRVWVVCGLADFVRGGDLELDTDNVGLAVLRGLELIDGVTVADLDADGEVDSVFTDDSVV